MQSYVSCYHDQATLSVASLVPTVDALATCRIFYFHQFSSSSSSSFYLPNNTTVCTFSIISVTSFAFFKFRQQVNIKVRNSQRKGVFCSIKKEIWVEIWTADRKKYITYHYATRGGPSNGHRYNVHKKLGEDRTCSFEDMLADRQIDKQTRSSQYSARLSGAE